jgi:hypothetical protein
MFLDSLGVPGMPETTPFRGFDGPKVVMKAGSMPRRQNCTIEDGGGVPPNGRKCDAKKMFRTDKNRNFRFRCCVRTMFLESLGVPGIQETTPFRGFGGPKVVMKAGSMPSEAKLYQ